MKQEFIEGVKEFLRIALIAVLPVIIAQLETGAIDIKMIGVLGLVAFLKALDKFVHEFGKEKNNKMLERGITRF